MVAHPGGAVVGPPAEVAAALDRLAAADGRDPLEQQVVQALRPFLAGDRTQTRPGARHWSRPAVAYWISGPRNQPGWHDCKAGSQVGRLLPLRPDRVQPARPKLTPEPAPAARLIPTASLGLRLNRPRFRLCWRMQVAGTTWSAGPVGSCNCRSLWYQ